MARAIPGRTPTPPLMHAEPQISVTLVGRRQFTTACSTCHVPSISASGRRARIDVSIDGVTFTRSKSDAAQRRTRPLVHVAWDDVTGAELQTTGKGRTVVRVGVAGVSAAKEHRHDPYALKVTRKQSESARRLVEHVNEEAAARRRWRGRGRD